MSFVPPVFSNYGKATKDLFKKKYDFDNSLKTVRRSCPFTFESSLTQSGGNYRGTLNIKERVKNVGEGELNISTSKGSESKASFKFVDLFTKGLNVTAGATTKDDDIKSDKLVYSVEDEYSRPNLAVTAAVKSNCDSTKVKATASFGLNDFAVGAGATFNVGSGFEVSDYNVGFEHSSPSVTISGFTERRLDNFTLSVLHRSSLFATYAARVSSDVGLREPKLTFGTEQKLNPDVNVKFKVDSDSTVGFAWEQRVAEPRLQLNLSASFKPAEFAQSVKAGAFGVGLTFGDY